MVQTGPKTQFGGEKGGLFKVTYQVGIEEIVRKDPETPIPKQRLIDKISKGIFLGIIYNHHRYSITCKETGIVCI